jgi:hypothetical protein
LDESNQRAHQKYVNRLDALVMGQSRDVEWASKIEHQAQDVIKKIPGIATLDQAQCGESLCRVAVKHADEGDRVKLNRAVADAEPFSFGTYYSYDGLVTTMYVLREGRRMPFEEP